MGRGESKSRVARRLALFSVLWSTVGPVEGVEARRADRSPPLVPSGVRLPLSTTGNGTL